MILSITFQSYKHQEASNSQNYTNCNLSTLCSGRFFLKRKSPKVGCCSSWGWARQGGKASSQHDIGNTIFPAVGMDFDLEDVDDIFQFRYIFVWNRSLQLYAIFSFWIYHFYFHWSTRREGSRWGRGRGWCIFSLEYMLFLILFELLGDLDTLRLSKILD